MTTPLVRRAACRLDGPHNPHPWYEIKFAGFYRHSIPMWCPGVTKLVLDVTNDPMCREALSDAMAELGHGGVFK